MFYFVLYFVRLMETHSWDIRQISEEQNMNAFHIWLLLFYDSDSQAVSFQHFFFFSIHICDKLCQKHRKIFFLLFKAEAGAQALSVHLIPK